MYKHYEKINITNQPYGVKVECINNVANGAFAVRFDGGFLYVYHHAEMIAAASAFTLRVKNKSLFK